MSALIKICDLIFNNSTIVATALGIPQDIIEDSGDLLNQLNNTKKCYSPKKYKIKAHLRFDRLVQHCIQHSDITPSVHRLLVHGYTFLKYAKEFDIPLRRLSESALEMRNKDRRRVKLMFSRKSSCIANIVDIFNYLYWTSDP